MKRKILVFTVLTFAALALLVPHYAATAKSANSIHPSAQVGSTQFVLGQAAATSGLTLGQVNRLRVPIRQGKQANAPARQGTLADCSNDTADGAEGTGGVDTDNVELQCGDQSTSGDQSFSDGAGVNAANGAKVISANSAQAKPANGAKAKSADGTGETDNVDQQVEETGGPEGSSPGAVGK